MAVQYLIGLDLGSSSIKAAVAEIKGDNRVSLVSLLKMPSEGIRRGVVDDFIDTTHAVSNVLAELKKISRNVSKHIVLSVGTPDIKVQNSKGVVAVSRADDEIYQDDIQRVIKSSQAISIPANRMILHALTKEYIVDGIDGIKDPLGMIGKRLEVNSVIVDTFAPNIKNLVKCVETLGANVDACTLSSIASASSVLTKNQKELGVVLIDIGAQKTSVAVYEEGNLIHAAVIPVGASNVTNDLAIGLRIPTDAAETIKLSFGSAMNKEVSARDTVDLSKVDSRAHGSVSKRFIAGIIEDRLAEIFELVNNEIKKVDKESQLPAGAVIVGGGAKTPYIAELARQELKLPAQIGMADISLLPAENGQVSILAEDPEFTTAIGLLLNESTNTGSKTEPSKPVNQTIKRILNYFIP
ncbi:MAG: cell division protein FtsA [Candidatus Harrisonbacteria bacterium CG10_big_fil_rev_8_21_14_0_10_38_8]|uniref:Cell division protein FtsA n=1 Tax=Candidatus Harrisonbacteria bacterium CG10_big_fil_rev_8_21_14_0_10_38_8 TaxID=1974582 RepID=A0A2M6WJQ4_9BACT|nr:MAG: cell division protein FtsA [Candidatus Harrisonbacteria bacterium CG10_big_fil_rev_8_21_14_0_10_38_8]